MKKINCTKGTPEQFRQAVENRMNELSGGVMESQQIQASSDPVFEDPQGMLGDAGEIYTLSELKSFWETEHESDPTMNQYSSFDQWFEDTKQWLTVLDYDDNIESASSMNVSSRIIRELVDEFEDGGVTGKAYNYMDKYGNMLASIEVWEDGDVYVNELYNVDYLPFNQLDNTLDREYPSIDKFESALESVLGSVNSATNTGNIGSKYGDPIEDIEECDIVSNSAISAATVDMNDEDSVDRYLHTLIGDIQADLSEFDLDNMVADQDENNLYITVGYNGTATEFTVPFGDLVFDWDNMDQDVAYVADTVSKHFHNLEDDLGNSDYSAQHIKDRIEDFYADEYDIPDSEIDNVVNLAIEACKESEAYPYIEAYFNGELDEDDDEDLYDIFEQDGYPDSVIDEVVSDLYGEE